MNLLTNILLGIGTKNMVITFVGIAIVFVALTVLYLIFNTIPKLLGGASKARSKAKTRKEERKARKEAEKQKDLGDKPEGVLTGEVNAAIAMALHLYFNELHDEESNIITIKDAPRTSWSSKVLTVSSFNPGQIKR